ncbi:MAG: NAD-dependent epimerase/dehydratase family protein [Anaerolineae bacterium]|nr:NAD-dependent epimerase/dehydratase family protein [Anaerolineae bacterium]
MRIFIIGGTRFIGPPVVRRLHAAGHTLWLFHRNPADVDLPKTVTHVYGDRAALVDRAKELRKLAPDLVLDMIPVAEAHAQAVMEVFRGVARRVVTISSQDVYRAYGRVNGTEPGPPDPVPLTEDSPLREQFYPYRGETPRTSDDPRRMLDDYDKILVERATMDDPDLPGTVLRLPMVYGPGDYQHRLYVYLKRMDDRRPAVLVNEQTSRWRWTRDYVENTAAAIALAVTDERAVGRTYNVGEERARSTAEWVQDMALVTGWNGRVFSAPDYQLPEDMKSRAGMEQELVVDTSLICEELGFEAPINRIEAMRRAVEWERANPPEHVDSSMFDYSTEDGIFSRLL